MGNFLSGVERIQRNMTVHLHCIVSNLKRISNMSKLPPPGKIFADAHGHRPLYCLRLLIWALLIRPCHCSHICALCLAFRVNVAGDLYQKISFEVGVLSTSFPRA